MLVHRTSASAPAALQPARRVDQQLAAAGPVAAMLQLGDLGEVDRPEQQPGRVQPAQPVARQLVEVAVVDGGAFPAHPADQPEQAHEPAQPLPVTGTAAPFTPAPASDEQEGDHLGDLAGRDPAAGVGLGHGGTVLRRVDGAGQDAVGAYAMGLQLVGQALGQAQDGALGGGVGGHALAGPGSGRGADGDDAAPPGRAHRRHDGPAHVERGDQVGLEQELPMRGIGSIDVGHGKGADGVDQPVDPAEALQGLLGQRLAGGGIAQVHAGCGQMALGSGETFKDPGERFFRAIHGDQPGATGGQQLDHGGAEVAPGTGHDHHVVHGHVTGSRAIARWDRSGPTRCLSCRQSIAAYVPAIGHWPLRWRGAGGGHRRRRAYSGGSSTILRHRRLTLPAAFRS